MVANGEQSLSMSNKESVDNNLKTKLKGYDFYHKVLGSPRYVVAPMVDQSELSWRMLCRKYKADLCYTPMFHSYLFVSDPKYRRDALQSCPEDRPLIIQFCGNDANTMLEAALLAQDYCDAIDINLGCPQAIAKRGHYGAFLQDEWDLLSNMVKTLDTYLHVPVTCKIRIFEDRLKTIKYAQMLEKAGCQLLTVHGRTRQQKGPLTGIADWSYIKEIRDNIKIPMFANGNIMGLEDVERCLQETGVDGVMSAEGILHNPPLFTGCTGITWELANEYLDLVKLYPCPMSYIRGHLFKLFYHILNLEKNENLREELAVANHLDKFKSVVEKIQQKYEPYHRGEKHLDFTPNYFYVNDSEADNSTKNCNLYLPPWLCQPHIRAPPETHKRNLAQKQELANNPNRQKREYFDDEGNQISRKRMKKLRRHLRKIHHKQSIDIGPKLIQRHEHILTLCQLCRNPLGLKCEYEMCRLCCREKCRIDNTCCFGHSARKNKIKNFNDNQKKEDVNGLNKELDESCQNKESNKNIEVSNKSPIVTNFEENL